jgi:hypothetical protein
MNAPGTRVPQCVGCGVRFHAPQPQQAADMLRLHLQAGCRKTEALYASIAEARKQQGPVASARKRP